MKNVLFPVTALLGLASVLPDGPQVEVATIGWEGVVGIPGGFGGADSDSAVLCHIPGRALQMPVSALVEHLEADAGARAIFEHYVALSAALLGQRAACGQRHAAPGRYATWLLQCADRRIAGAPVPLTQNLLAFTLGLQRTTVSTIATQFEEQGLTRSSYGKVWINDRAGLRACACACYPRFHTRTAAFLARARKVAEKRDSYGT